MMGTIVSVGKYFAAACTPGAGGNFLSFPTTWYKYLNDSEVIAGKCTPKIDLTNHPEQIGLILLAIVEIALRIAALVAVAFIIVGGFKYITSQGNGEATKNARNTIINAIVGLVIAMVATFVVSFVASNLT